MVFLFVENKNMIAQKNDSLRLLEEVSVISEKIITYNKGIKKTLMDSASTMNQVGNSLSNLLQLQNIIYVKSYGPNMLASSSFRGGNAAQTSVFWGNFNINSPSLGQSDLSLIPVIPGYSYTLDHSGSGSLRGSGSVGGSINFSSQPTFDNTIKTYLNLNTDSYSNNSIVSSTEVSSINFSNKTSLIFNNGANNYEYVNNNEQDKRIEKENHAQYNSKTLIQENSLKLKPNQLIAVKFWLQENERQIPSGLYSKSSNADQQDKIARGIVEYSYNKKKSTINLRSGIFREEMIYTNREINLISAIQTTMNISEVDVEHRFSSHHKLNFGVSNNYAQAATSNYNGNAVLNRFSILANYHFSGFNNKLHVTANIREEIISSGQQPFTWSVGVEYHLNRFIDLKATGGKVYRNPTLNDLYWYPGGNINLLPESGYTEEVGLLIYKTFNKFSTSLEGTIFNRNIKNWIIWLPGSPGIFSPQNLGEVWSRGSETQLKLSYQNNKLQIKLSANTNYVLSTNEKARYESDESVSRQLIFVPTYSGSGQLSIHYANVSVSYNHSYTGYRYTSSDNYEYLEPFQLANLFLNYDLKLKNKYTIGLFFQINNIWNTEYETYINYPMPLRNYKAGLILTLNHKTKNT